MSKTSALVKNTAIIGLGTLSTKALTFFLLPLYTNILLPNDYGLVDALITISSLIIPFVGLEINSGVFRFLIGEDNLKKYSYSEVVSTGVAIESTGLLIAIFAAGIVETIVDIPHFIPLILYILSLAFSKLALDTTRGLGDTIAYSIANVIITLNSLILNVVLILFFKWGAVAILVATAFGNFSGVFFLFIHEKLYKYIGRKSINREIGRKMLKYTLPLIPNTVSWWIASASDRIIVLGFLGTSANGIYAVAHKIPGIYTNIFTVFSLAWTESVARNATDNAYIEETVKKSVNVMIYMLLGIVSCTSLFFDFLIGNKYDASYWHILILLIAIFFSSLSSLYGGIFGGKMDSKSIAVTTIIGAIINIILNLLMVNYIGLYSASISTMASYIVISLLRGRRIKEWYQIRLFSLNDISLIVLGLISLIGYYYHNYVINIFSIIVITMCFSFFNWSAITSCVIRIKKMVKK